MKTPKRRLWRRHWRRSSVFIVNSEYISHLFEKNKTHFEHISGVSIVNFEQAHVN